MRQITCLEKTTKYPYLALALTILLVSPNGCFAKTTARTPLQICLKRADDLPDMAAAEAAAWIKRGGGTDAHLCRAFAQANRGMHQDAAREFWALAASFAKTDKAQGVSMYDLAGQEFLRAKDTANAEDQFAFALQIAPKDLDALMGRAKVHMQYEKYWDALDDLNEVLAQDPKNAVGYRLRGDVWMHLGNEKNAEEDFEQAEMQSAHQTKKDNRGKK